MWTELAAVRLRAAEAVLLPSAVRTENRSSSVVKGGRELELKVARPTPLEDQKSLHGIWLQAETLRRTETYHRKPVVLKNALETFRK